jgi:hypothetical protein
MMVGVKDGDVRVAVSPLCLENDHRCAGVPVVVCVAAAVAMVAVPRRRFAARTLLGMTVGIFCRR